MAKRKQPSRRPQPKQKKKRCPSQFDKRGRLDRKNPQRKKTTKAKVPLVGPLLAYASSMARTLDARMAFRLSIIMAGMMLADDRRVSSAWFAAGGVQDDWDRFYDCLISIGRHTSRSARPLAVVVVRKFDPGPEGHLTVAGDDSTTKRYGRHVEGAGVHHNPTPGPAGGEWLYGHNWVSLCLLCWHPLWGVIALPLLSRLYEGVIIFSRLRKDAALFDLPPELKAKHRGRPRVYGLNRISRSKRAASRQGWQSITYHCRGSEVTCQFKSFLATSKLIGGVIRVVIVRFEDGGWAAYFAPILKWRFATF